MDGDAGFGAILRGLRLAAGLSQEALADRARLSAESISALERGTRRTPYRETVRLLADALELTAAHRARLEAAALRPSRPRTAAAKVPKNNLPLALTSFHGRDGALVELLALLDRSRIVTVVGPGGVGKTRLAIEAAASGARSRFAGGIWFIDLAPLRDGSPIVASIAAVLGVRERGGTSLESAVAAKLRTGGELLLVLDNCEHVLSNVAHAAQFLLSSCPRVRLLATTREPLRIGGEMLYAVDPLAAEPAAQMFVDRAVAVSRDVDPECDSANIASIVRRLDGLPLAIELAAARLRSLSPAEIAESLDQRFRVLTTGSRTAPPRQQTLYATLEWSHDLLSEREREVFRRCAIFAGSWTLADAESVCGDDDVTAWNVADCIMNLVDKSLLVAQRNTATDVMRFAMLETTHEYALERLSEHGEHDRIAGCHLRRFKRLVEDANAAYEATGSDAPLAALAPDLDNLRLALHWSLAGGQIRDGVALSAASGRIWHRLGLSAEGIRRMRSMSPAIEEHGTPLAARWWTALSCLYFSAGQMSMSFDAATRGVLLARAAENRPSLILALLEYAHAAAILLGPDEAEAALDEAASLAGPAPPGLQQVRLRIVRGVAHALRGNMAEAAASYRAALQVYTRLGDEYGRTTVILNLAEAQHECGDTLGAIDSVRARLPYSARDLDPERHVTLLANLAAYLIAVGDRSGARDVACEVLELDAAADPSSSWVTLALEILALVLALEGDAVRAGVLAGYCESALAAVGYVREFTERSTHARLAMILREQLPEAERERLKAEGAALTPQHALDEALRA